MEHDPIRQLLQEADERKSFDPSSSASDLTDRVLKTQGKRRQIRTISALALLAISATILPIVARKTISPTAELASRSKPALQGRVRIDQELRDLEAQIAINDQIIRRLNAIEAIQRADAEIARLQSSQFAEQQIIERAASAVVYQTDRMYRATGQSASALQAYREVIEHFPDTVSAEQARQRVTDIERAG